MDSPLLPRCVSTTASFMSRHDDWCAVHSRSIIDCRDEMAEALRRDDDGRPPLPAETVAHDKGVMEGYLAAKRDYGPSGMYYVEVLPTEAELTAAIRSNWFEIRPHGGDWVSPSTAASNILAALKEARHG